MIIKNGLAIGGIQSKVIWKQYKDEKIDEGFSQTLTYAIRTISTHICLYERDKYRPITKVEEMNTFRNWHWLYRFQIASRLSKSFRDAMGCLYHD